ncbi:hypothetical protein [Nocardioides sp.]|uniref:hypothetical protein n=1 Tax=Nocardioides sp. TaxID=35761 RepID=UPI00286C71BB|nr:hypothetical protein [Nocardioides sp.]
MTSTRTMKTAGAASVLALVLAGCGGGGASGAPTDASQDEFCEKYTTGFLNAFEEIDPEASEQEQAEAILESLKTWADDMSEVGTPDDMSDEARDGFELTIESIQDLNADDLQDEEAMAELEDELSGDDKEAAAALQTYVTDNCDFGGLPGGLEAPSLPAE